MSVRKEVERIITREFTVKTIGQLSRSLQLLILETIDEIREHYDYSPRLVECCYLIMNNTVPQKCANTSCNNIGKFSIKNRRYDYCSKKCSDSDSNKHIKTQEKRRGKINYHEMNIRSAKTRGEFIDMNSGLNGHQLAWLKTKKTREDNGVWLKNTILAHSRVTTEDRISRSVKRTNTLIARYGVSHFGGGYSKIKNVCICGVNFLVQGYEDVAIYQLIEKGHTPNNIITISREKKYALEYEFNGKLHQYFPDIFLKDENKFIEVKSEYWFKKERARCVAKQNAANKLGILYEILMYTAEDKNEIKRIREAIKLDREKENCTCQS